MGHSLTPIQALGMQNRELSRTHSLGGKAEIPDS